MLKDMVKALRSNDVLQKLLADGSNSIYHQANPDGCRYPNVVYSVISDVPALHGDNQELQSRVTVRLHIVTDDGDDKNILTAVQDVMLGLGFMRVQAVEFFEDGLKVKVIDYRIGVEV